MSYNGYIHCDNFKAQRSSGTHETGHLRANFLQTAKLENYNNVHLELGFALVSIPWNMFVEVMVVFLLSPRVSQNNFRQNANWTGSEFPCLRVPNQTRERGILVHPTVTRRDITGPLPICWAGWCARFDTRGRPLPKMSWVIYWRDATVFCVNRTSNLCICEIHTHLH